MINVVLPRDLQRFLQRLVDEKVIESPDEAIAEGLYLLQDQYRLFQAKQAEMEKELQPGLEQADRGELLDSIEVFRQLRERAAQSSGST
jgi:Arc/MetJ-type ribon-helix-helix transcriptional regulator